MSGSDDPPRLVDPGSPASAHVRRLLEECRADVGTEQEVQKLAVSLALWPTGTGTAPVKAAAGKAVTATALKVAVGAIVVAAAGGVWLSSARAPSSKPAAPSATTLQPQPAIDVPAPPPTTPAVTTPPTADEGTPPSNDVSKNIAPSASPNAASAARRPASDSPSEADLLGQAQAALASDPARALSLCDQHRRSFPHGLLVQEREVIAIEALERLGRTAAAKARGERFLRAFPNSAHRSKIESTVGGK